MLFLVTCSTEMAAAAVEAVRGEAQVRLHRRAERGHAARARAQDHPRPRRHVQPKVQTRQARLSRVSQYRQRNIPINLHWVPPTTSSVTISRFFCIKILQCSRFSYNSHPLAMSSFVCMFLLDVIATLFVRSPSLVESKIETLTCFIEVLVIC